MNKFLLSAALLCFAVTANAQQGGALTAKDYERAESALSYNTEPFIDHGSVRPNWLTGDKFWFRDLNAHGSEFILVDPVKKTRSAVFDQGKLAAALSTATGKSYTGLMLPFQSFTYSTDGKSVIFQADGKQWACDLTTYQVSADNSMVAKPGGGRFQGRRMRAGSNIASPDGTKEAFLKDYNLWVRDVKSRKETPTNHGWY
jgi:hypothetical protein